MGIHVAVRDRILVVIVLNPPLCCEDHEMALGSVRLA